MTDSTLLEVEVLYFRPSWTLQSISVAAPAPGLSPSAWDRQHNEPLLHVSQRHKGLAHHCYRHHHAGVAAMRAVTLSGYGQVAPDTAVDPLHDSSLGLERGRERRERSFGQAPARGGGGPVGGNASGGVGGGGG